MEAVHVTAVHIPPGALVRVDVDWTRRFDHAQQHSGQHIISDIAEELFHWKTHCWAMGKDLKSYVEFRGISPTFQELETLEAKVNEFIRAAHPMVLEESFVHEARPDSLPKDIHEGVVRRIGFGPYHGPCCGTHVSSTAQIQIVKLISTDKVRGGNARVWFACGNRVLALIRNSLAVEQDLNVCCYGEEKLATIKTMQKEKKNRDKELQELERKLGTAALG
ncbi:Alanyl-tRNA editing protein Aarsd1 [Kappamyces sp. JEL0829]|nr:Alanyl-tRNA editing protein Aarsd1 [Kappamyces sp. JEL0829]